MAPVRAEDLERLRDALAEHNVEYLFLIGLAAATSDTPVGVVGPLR